MTERNVTEVVHTNAVETSIEIGTPATGKIKFPVTTEELDNEWKAEQKIEKVQKLMEMARARLIKKPSKPKKGKPDDE